MLVSAHLVTDKTQWQFFLYIFKNIVTSTTLLHYCFHYHLSLCLFVIRVAQKFWVDFLYSWISLLSHNHRRQKHSCNWWLGSVACDPFFIRNWTGLLSKIALLYLHWHCSSIIRFPCVRPVQTAPLQNPKGWEEHQKRKPISLLKTMRIYFHAKE